MSIRFSIRTKLVGMISIILLIATAAIIVFATTLFARDNVARIQESNLETARIVAAEINNDLFNLSEKMRLIGTTMLIRLRPDQMDALHQPFFDREKDFLGETILSIRRGSLQPINKVTHQKLLKKLEISPLDVLNLHAKFDAKKLRMGEESITSDIIRGEIPVVTIAIPLLTDDKGNVTHATIATILQNRFLQAVESGSIISSFIVDSNGYILAHPDQKRVLKKENLTHLKIVKDMLTSKTNNGQTRFTDEKSGKILLGAFKKVGFGGIGVISHVEEAKALEAARKVRRTSIIMTAMIAIVAFIVVFLFSLTLTRPLVRLVEACKSILQGSYDVKLKRGANDEIGDLTKSFNSMATGLAEREKIKNAFSKFHSKDVADKILEGDLKLSGERKFVTVFFSDIRSFTTISEKLQPEEVVDLINGYMTRMVAIIFAHGGVIDKYVGDAIMAIYGTPAFHEDDPLRAVAASLRMRAELVRFNESRAAAGKPGIAIGMGMHSGPVVAGNVGSPERMEYTILGDTVNLASRMESSTKNMKTDILISSDTYEVVKDSLECKYRGAVKVKGKEQETRMYEVISFLPGKEYIPVETGHTGESNLDHLRSHPDFRPPGIAETPAAERRDDTAQMTKSIPPPFHTDLTGTRTPPPPKPEMTGEVSYPGKKSA